MEDDHAKFVQELSLGLALSMTVVSIILFYRPAWYGRYSQLDNYIFAIDPSFAWCLQEVPSFLIPTVFAMNHTLFLMRYPINAMLLGFLCLHYFYRSFIYAFKVKSRSKVPISIVLSAGAFTSINGYIMAYQLCHTPQSHLGSFIIGSFCTIAGWIINIQSDGILIQLRHNITSSSHRYRIPYGGFFQYVSCANYFGECMEWVGFAIAAQTAGSIVFAYTTVGNLLPRALAHHSWYRLKFKNYPQDRTALIPFII